MVPIGGVFLAVMGVAMILGAAFPRWRLRSVAIGAFLGAVAAASSALHFIMPPPPTTGQMASLALAVALEMVAFVELMPRLYRNGERAAVAGTLAIVGAHFLVMLPAFGLLIAVLGVLCVLNGSLVWLVKRYSLGAAWFIDGMFKLVLGSIMFVAPGTPH